MLLTRYAQIATTQDKANSYLVRPPPTSIFHFSPIMWPAALPMTMTQLNIHSPFPGLCPVPTRLRPRRQSHVRCARGPSEPKFTTVNVSNLFLTVVPFQHHMSWVPTQIHPRIPTRPWPAAGTTSAKSIPHLHKRLISYTAQSLAGQTTGTGFTTSAATGQRQR